MAQSRLPRRKPRPADPTGYGRRKGRPRTKAGQTELAFRRHAAEQGWTVSKRGWPDFILRKNGRLVFVEVKSDPATGLKDEQIEVAQILARAGLEVYRWDPEKGFRRIHPALRPEER